MKQETKQMIKSAAKAAGKYLGTLLKVMLTMPILAVALVTVTSLEYVKSIVFAILGKHKVAEEVICEMSDRFNNK